MRKKNGYDIWNMANIATSTFLGSQSTYGKMSQKCGSSYQNTLVIQIIIISAGVVTDKVTEECAKSRGHLMKGRIFFFLIKKQRRQDADCFPSKSIVK